MTKSAFYGTINLVEGGTYMLDKEVLELFCEQMNNASIFNRAFIEKLTSVLKQSKYFENWIIKNLTIV